MGRKSYEKIYVYFVNTNLKQCAYATISIDILERTAIKLKKNIAMQKMCAHCTLH